MGLHFKFIDSPVGKLKLAASDRGLAAILWHNDSPRRVRLADLTEAPDHPILTQTESQLAEYFSGTRQQFDLPLDPRGTAFQRAVWNALLAIPYGETRTYGQLARQLGNPNATRAVGAANGRNPLSIVAPCHRVVGSTGELRGFAGGLETKSFLLELEAHTLRLTPDAQPLTVRHVTSSPHPPSSIGGVK